jgi:hypothetical protein
MHWALPIGPEEIFFRIRPHQASCCRCTPVVKKPGAGFSWLPSENLTGDEVEAQRGLAFETGDVLAELARSEKLMQSESLVQSYNCDSLYTP